VKRAVIYVRVSHHKQLDGASLEDQERTCRIHAERSGLKITHVYRDEGRSAYKDDINNRPAFKQLLNDARHGTFRVVLVYKLDRFARKVRVYYNALFDLEQAGVELESATEPMTDSAAGRLSSGMMAQFAEFYSAQLSERMRTSVAGKVARGDWVGDVPFGYERAGATLRPGPLASWVVIIFCAYVAGHTSTAIARAMNATPLRLRSGRNWTRDSVLMVLNNRSYIGYGRARSIGEYQSRHQALVTGEIFAQAANQLRARRRPSCARPSTARPKQSYTPRCAACDQIMHRHKSGRAQSRNGYYRCRAATNGNCTATRGVRIDQVDAQVELLRKAGEKIATVWLEAPRGIKKWEE
jgi:DNA invertase Pin-like site-specific DNA recombinase